MEFQPPSIKIPGLGLTKKMSIDVGKKLRSYSIMFQNLLMKSLTEETEIQIKTGALTPMSIHTLGRLQSEIHIMNYSAHIFQMYDPWCRILSGQPNTPFSAEKITEIIPNVISEFEKYIIVIQEKATRFWFEKDNQMCKALCTTKHKIVNFTNCAVPKILEEMLSHGINFVPTVARNDHEITEIVENDLKASAIRFFRESNHFYPVIDHKAKLQTILIQLMQQSQSNSSDITFYCKLHESYTDNLSEFLNNINVRHLKNYKDIKQAIPDGTILSISDKGLGPCLLPVEWYITQYQHQAEIGSHVLLEISEQACLLIMQNNIKTFRSSLNVTERTFLSSYFVKCNPNFRVGCLKLVPKIHKIKGTVTQETWKVLPSRPIRGAENCPINGYSIALCKLLQEMHKTLKEMYTKGTFGVHCKYPVIMGCEEYADKISQLKYPKQKWGDICIISGDFSDAYTKSSLSDLDHSINKLGK